MGKNGITIGTKFISIININNILTIIALIGACIALANQLVIRDQLKKELNLIHKNVSTIDRGLGILREEVMADAYTMKLSKPCCEPIVVNSHTIPIELTLGRDPEGDDNIWILGHEHLSDKYYPLKQCKFINGQREYIGSLSLPPEAKEGPWSLVVVAANERDARLFKERNSQQSPLDELPDDIWFLESTKILAYNLGEKNENLGK